MTLNEAALRKLGKEEIIKLALEYQSKFDSTLSSINDIKTGPDVIITKQVNTKLCDKMKFLECQCWANEQYSGVNASRYLMFQNPSLIMIWMGKS